MRDDAPERLLAGSQVPLDASRLSAGFPFRELHFLSQTDCSFN